MSANPISDFESALKAKHPGVPIKRVRAPRIKGFAYVRQPDLEAYQTMRINRDASGADAETKLMGFASYVRGCFLGAITADGAEVDYDKLRTVEGPAYAISGPLGHAVNSLAGEDEQTMEDL